MILESLKKAFNVPLYFSFRKNRTDDIEKLACLLKKLECSHKKLRMFKEFWDNASDAFILANVEDGSILDANNSACSLYGYPCEAFVKMNILNISTEPSSTKAVWQDRIEHVPLRWHKTCDGREIPVQATISYFTVKDQEVAALIIRPIVTEG